MEKFNKNAMRQITGGVIDIKLNYNLMALQKEEEKKRTKQQPDMNALSLASQASQAVLKLFG